MAITISEYTSDDSWSKSASIRFHTRLEIKEKNIGQFVEQDGRVKRNIKYFPILVAAGCSMFFANSWTIVQQ